MPPIAEQLLAPQIDAFRGQIAELASCTSSDEAYRRMVTMHKSTLQILENVSISIQNSERSIAESESRMTASHRKPLSESRCVSTLKLLGSDKSEFKSWNEKLINALSQSLGKHWRTFMENLNRRLDQGRKVLEVEELNHRGRSIVESARHMFRRPLLRARREDRRRRRTQSQFR